MVERTGDHVYGQSDDHHQGWSRAHNAQDEAEKETYSSGDHRILIHQESADRSATHDNLSAPRVVWLLNQTTALSNQTSS